MVCGVIMSSLRDLNAAYFNLLESLHPFGIVKSQAIACANL